MHSNPRKTKHIVHVVHSFVTGGLENGIVNIINNLPKGEYKHTIVCVVDHDVNFFSRVEADHVDIINLNKPPGTSPAWLFKCWGLFRQLKPDICHTRNLSAIEAQMAAFFSKVPYRIHGEHGWDINDIGGTNKKYQLLRRLFKPFIHQYVALSIEAINYLKNDIKVKSNRINHICNGVNIEKFTPGGNRSLLPAGFSGQNDIIFGTVGRLAKVKNQIFLMTAFLKLWIEQPELRNKIRLIIIGDGVLMPTLQKMVTDANADSAVWFTGKRDNVAQLMQQMDVFVLPSLAEGISNTILEAMATGLPIIATNVGGNAELVLPSHKCSHIIEINSVDKLVDAMSAYINNEDQLRKDSNLVRKHCVENFSLEVMVDKYHHLYQNINLESKKLVRNSK